MQRPASGFKSLFAVLAGVSLMTAAAAEPGLAGNWGGPQVRLSLTETGGKLDMSCAAATIDGPIHPDASGKFSATGRYEAFVGGPTQADAPPTTTALHVMGHVEGNTMHITLHQKGAKAETYTLERDRRVKLIRCQ